MNLTKNFTLQEMVISSTATRLGYDNKPSSEVIRNLRLLCANVLQPLRDVVNRPVVITSGYRSADVNKAIRGAKTSQHLSGQAADLYVPGMRLAEVFDILKKLPHDQLIMEFGQWIHVSFTDKNRGEQLIARLEDGKTVYSKII